ncbi:MULTISPECIES: helix-turn-helix domain-containing protein [Streptomyces]|uniref:helix-turn-helix domain-containing protein n=1 Tax=Streptomyces TaxID=1883 RepID=UPI00099C53BB|nr:MULTISPECIES: helix-turn-helix transcriptional regulator [Streptomyces]MCC0580331.1 helix-turn-helix domain-containing protein [Streptomyces californicus]
MPPDSPQEIGRRIASFRRARRFTQTALAAASYVSYAMIRAIERGARRPSDEVLESIADALGVDVARLRTDPGGSERRVHQALPAISEAIAGYDLAFGLPKRRSDELAHEVAMAQKWRLAAQYGRIAAVMPGLLADAIRYMHAAPSAEQRYAAQLLASAARSADAVAYKHGAFDLSARLIDLMRWAAERADDPLMQATAAYVRAETFFAARAHAGGLMALERAIDASPPPGERRSAAVRGALHMRAAVIAARAQNAAAADTHLVQATHLSGQVAEGTYLGTAFGPESVRIHEVSVAVGLGRDYVEQALRAAAEWAPSPSLPSERRSGFYIELAKAQEWAGLPAEAFSSLRVARAVAPQHTREHPWTREIARNLRCFYRSDAEALTHFARWAGAV